MSSHHKKGAMRNDEKCCKIDGILHLPKEVEEELERAGGLNHLRGSLPMVSTLNVVAGMHRALADPLRLSVLYTLSHCDLCPCVLKEVTGLTDSKLSYHLNVLEEAGLVSSWPQNKWRIYSITDLGRSALI